MDLLGILGVTSLVGNDPNIEDPGERGYGPASDRVVSLRIVCRALYFLLSHHDHPPSKVLPFERILFQSDWRYIQMRIE